jgi:D-alanyl-D-alanine dipeptidase
MNSRFSRLAVLLTLFFVCCASSSKAQKRRTPEFDWDAKLKNMGFLDVCYWEPSIQEYLVYRTSDNFTGAPLYNRKLTKAWLHPKAAKMLIRAQELLQRERPELAILILDAARPLEIQEKINAWAKATGNNYYIADPAKGGGLHNYGMAVDITLIDSDGMWLPMGTPFDYFGPESHIDKEETLLKQRRITKSEYDNRRFMRRIMEAAGFRTVSSEWWHFNACSREEAREKYLLIDRDR